MVVVVVVVGALVLAASVVGGAEVVVVVELGAAAVGAAADEEAAAASLKNKISSDGWCSIELATGTGAAVAFDSEAADDGTFEGELAATELTTISVVWRLESMRRSTGKSLAEISTVAGVLVVIETLTKLVLGAAVVVVVVVVVDVDVVVVVVVGVDATAAAVVVLGAAVELAGCWPAGDKAAAIVLLAMIGLAHLRRLLLDEAAGGSAAAAAAASLGVELAAALLTGAGVVVVVDAAATVVPLAGCSLDAAC